jgi:hypothetical protein
LTTRTTRYWGTIVEGYPKVLLRQACSLVARILVSTNQNINNLCGIDHTNRVTRIIKPAIKFAKTVVEENAKIPETTKPMNAMTWFRVLTPTGKAIAMAMRPAIDNASMIN